MKQRKLFMVRDDPREDWHLAMDADGYPNRRTATEEECTLAEMAEMLDRDAENCNAHGFVGVHTALAKILVGHVFGLGAHMVMRSIVNHGGLHGIRSR